MGNNLVNTPCKRAPNSLRPWGPVGGYRAKPGKIKHMTVTTKAPSLINYQTGEFIRMATKAETHESLAAAEYDGGAGVIVVDGVSCWVEL